MKRGDVVLVSIPYLSGTQSKRRPALVIQDDALNSQLIHTIVIAISSQVGRPVPASHYPLDPSTPDGKAAGVHHPSVVRCDRVFTIEKREIERTIGSLSASAMAGVEECIKASFGMTA